MLGVTISKMVDLNDPIQAKFITETLYNKGITKKLIEKAKISFSYDLRKTLKKHEPYFAAKDAIKEINSNAKYSQEELAKAQKKLDKALEEMGKVFSPPHLIVEVASILPDKNKKQKLLMDYAKESIIPIPKYRWLDVNKYKVDPEKFAKFVGENLLGEDKVKNAEIILELTKNLKFDREDDKNMLGAFEKLYNKRVLGLKEGEKVPEKFANFDKMVDDVGGPANLGKMMYRENYKDPKLQTLVKDEHVGKFEKATAILRSNLGQNGLVVSEEDKGKVVENAVKNCSFKTMSNIVRATEGYIDYQEKGWLKKAVSRFADGICRTFAAAKENVKSAFKEFMVNNGAVVKEKVASKNIPNVGVKSQSGSLSK